MKFAYMVATNEIQGTHVTAIKGDYDDLFKLIKENKYTGVELMVKNPFVVDFHYIEKVANKYCLDIPVMCTGEMYGEDQLSFGDKNPSVRKEAIKRTKELMKIASNFNAHVNIGRLRGRFVEEIPKSDTLKWIKEGLLEAAISNQQVKLLIEPINKYYANFLLNTQEGIDFIKQLNTPNIRLMLDYIHMFIEQENIEESVNLARGYFDHVHVCDSDRKPLGLGEYDLFNFFKCLSNINYDGYISVEAFPTTNYERDLKTSYRVLKETTEKIYE